MGRPLLSDRPTREVLQRWSDPVMDCSRVGQIQPDHPPHDGRVQSVVVMTLSSLRWQRFLLIPCAALTAAALQVGADPAEARHGGSNQRPQLTAPQQDALFQVRRDWVLKTYPQRLALLKNEQRCLEGAASPQAFRTCKRQNRLARRALHQQGRALINAERQRLGLEPLLPPAHWREGLDHHQKGRS